RSYHLVLGPDRDRAIAGRADEADVTFSMDEATAREISSGEISTEEAFITGRLDIDGDPGPLIEAYRAQRGDA
ncbi:MAG: SCP2 sterol-binding domain-containing protein, partial [Actinomycetota bacterium]